LDEILKISKLTKHYGRIKAVDHLDLTILRGMVFGILGPNGSGKTTTLGMVLDVINKTSGSYEWFGEPGSKESRKKVGAILETPVFYPYLSGQKNLEIIADIKEVSVNRVEPVISKVGLFDRKDDKFKTYSLGMKQRLAIAGALLCDPEVMILDEPTNGLDPQGIADIRDLIIKIGQEGKTIILASHLLDEVQKVCTHFAVLKKGKMLYSGNIEEVTKGAETVEIETNDESVYEVLQNWERVEKVEKILNRFMVTLDQNTKAEELNKYLFDHGMVLSHLVTQRKSLEKQFLEILEESE